MTVTGAASSTTLRLLTTTPTMTPHASAHLSSAIGIEVARFSARGSSTTSPAYPAPHHDPWAASTAWAPFLQVRARLRTFVYAGIRAWDS